MSSVESFTIGHVLGLLQPSLKELSKLPTPVFQKQARASHA